MKLKAPAHSGSTLPLPGLLGWQCRPLPCVRGAALWWLSARAPSMSGLQFSARLCPMTAPCGDLLSLPAGPVHATVPLDAAQTRGISLQGSHTWRPCTGFLPHLTQVPSPPPHPCRFEITLLPRPLHSGPVIGVVCLMTFESPSGSSLRSLEE